MVKFYINLELSYPDQLVFPEFDLITDDNDLYMAAKGIKLAPLLKENFQQMFQSIMEMPPNFLLTQKFSLNSGNFQVERKDGWKISLWMFCDEGWNKTSLIICVFNKLLNYTLK